MRLLHAQTQTSRVTPGAHASLPFVVRTLTPGWRPGVLPRFPKAAAGSRIAAGSQSVFSTDSSRTSDERQQGRHGLRSATEGDSAQRATRHTTNVVLWSEGQGGFARRPLRQARHRNLADEIEHRQKRKARTGESNGCPLADLLNNEADPSTEVKLARDNRRPAQRSRSRSKAPKVSSRRCEIATGKRRCSIRSHRRRRRRASRNPGSRRQSLDDRSGVDPDFSSSEYLLQLFFDYFFFF